MRYFPAVAAFLGLLPLASCGVNGKPATIGPQTFPQIAFEAPGIPGGGAIQELYTINLNGTGLTQLTKDGLNKFLPHFSPSGTQLLYSKFISGQYGDISPVTDVAVLDLSTGKESILTTSGIAFQPVWSPSGTQIAYASYNGTGLWIMNADGSNPQLVAKPSGGNNDQRWNDLAWSSENWILFAVGQSAGNCFKVRLDKIRPDGTSRTRITDGGPICTPPGMEQYGDADPGFSADGQTIYSSRGLGPAPGQSGRTLRHLYSFSSAAWTPDKVETDLSLPARPDCIVGVPKASPNNSQVLVYLECPNQPNTAGVTITDTAGSTWTYLTNGFGADWNPAFKQ